MTDPVWAPYAVSAAAATGSIHGPLPLAGPSAGELLTFTWQQLQQIVSGFVNEFLRQVAVALGAIDIFGFRPYQALVEIGEDIAESKARFDALLAGLDLPTIDDVVTQMQSASSQAAAATASLAGFLSATGQASLAALGAALQTLIEWLTAIPANLLSGALPTGVTVGGNAIGTLLSNIDATGGLLASGITGALNTGVTVAGVGIGDLLQNLDGAGQIAGSAITGAITDATIAGSAITGSIAGDVISGITTVEQQITNGIYEGLNAVAPAVDQAASTVAANVNGWITGLFNTFRGPGAVAATAGQDEASEAASAQVANIVSLQTDVLALSTPPASTGLLSATVDFGNYPDGGMPGDFTVLDMRGVLGPGAGAAGAGTMAIRDGRVVYVPDDDDLGFSRDNAFLAVYDTPSRTEYQEVSAVWTGLTHDDYVYQHLGARLSSDGLTGVYWVAMPFLNQWQFWTVVDGVVTASPFAVNSAFSMKPGAKYTLRCGTPNGVKNVQILENGVPMYDHWGDDNEWNLSTSVVGPSNRLTGLGFSALTTSASFDPLLPMPASSFSASDNIASVVTPKYSYGYFVPPTIPAWTAGNMPAGATWTTDADGAKRLTCPSQSGDNIAYQYLTYPSGPFKLKIYVEIGTTSSMGFMGMPGSAAVNAGICLSDGTKVINVGHGVGTFSGGNFQEPGTYAGGQKMNSVSSYNSTFNGAWLSTRYIGGIPQWWSIEDTGTDRIIMYSVDGQNWHGVTVESNTAFLTPTRIGFYIDNVSTGKTCYARLLSWEGV